MRVSEDDYEDKLTQINRLNREIVCLKEKLDSVKHQRDAILDCLVAVANIGQNTIEDKYYLKEIEQRIANARATMDQSEML